MPTDPPPFYTLAPDGVRLTVRLTPRGGVDRLDGVVQASDGRRMLAIRVAALPVDGAANAALIALLAKALRLRKADVAIVSGSGHRLKVIHLAGDAPTLVDRLAAWVRSAD